MTMKLLWIDLETSGLDPHQDLILEVAAIVADLERPFNSKGHELHAVLFALCAAEDLHPKVLEMHTKNGLLAECERSTVSYLRVEDELLDMVPEVEDREDMTALAGSSVHFDLGFIRVHMPRLAKRLSHRVYDVSAVKLFARSLGMPKLPRAEAHRARADLQESIEHARLCADWLCTEWVPNQLTDRSTL